MIKRTKIKAKKEQKTNKLKRQFYNYKTSLTKVYTIAFINNNLNIH